MAKTQPSSAQSAKYQQSSEKLAISEIIWRNGGIESGIVAKNGIWRRSWRRMKAIEA
jgi:hypothetical protein